eukprot:CAMPEP_0175871522 /NCGR_PEP_ID=MMETSP0107_2-20121207/37183_1 /TAXON_ID=195067 ORGANISM="Goniomonas pacifica, Strain CCMP1869" /NCGR_SAMPLE_ID=MMETSP0107_2 /ASSEMBLY_ACC=CAM_ASM_000203 /LENGTH=53 /DNA_ID=CAMNT_0017189913 /DNA_START=10 /DNA_END=171 /DNA_ORIENTATION=-
MIRPLASFVVGSVSGVYLAQNYELPDMMSMVKALKVSLEEVDQEFRRGTEAQR